MTTNKELKKIEKLIDSNIKNAWKQNGILLLKIRDESLYQAEYGTFENYLEKRWDYDRSRGYQLINAAEMSKKMDLVAPEMSKIFDKESHAKELLTGLNTDSERIRVAELVAKKSGDGSKVTAAIVRETIDEFKASGEVAPEIDFEALKAVQEEKNEEIKLAKEAKKAENNSDEMSKILDIESQDGLDDSHDLHGIIDDLKAMNDILLGDNAQLKKIINSDADKSNVLSLTERLNTAQTNLNKALRKIEWMSKRLIPSTENDKILSSDDPW